MITYHVCFARQPSGPASIEYKTCIMQRGDPIDGADKYEEFCRELAAKVGWDQAGMVVVSMSRL